MKNEENIQFQIIRMYKDVSESSSLILKGKARNLLFNSFYDRVVWKVKNYMYDKINLRGEDLLDLVKDSVLDALLKLEKKLEEGEADERFEGLLVTIAIRTVFKSLNKNLDITPSIMEFDSKQPNYEERVISKEIMEEQKMLFLRMIESLSPNCKKIILLWKFMGFSPKALAEFGYGKNASVVSVNLTRCVKKMKPYYKKQNELKR